MSAPGKYFPSKVDAWIAIPFGLAMVAGGAAVWLASVRGHGLGIGAVLAGVFSFVLWTFLGTGYTVTADLLIVRSAAFQWRIRLRTIRALRRTRNPISSPALSLDRIEVQYDGGSVLVSPKDVPGFVDAIRAGAPALDLGPVLGSASGGPWVT